MIDKEIVIDAARGRWLEILPVLAPCLTDAADAIGRHVTCPLHGGKADFRFHKTKGPESGLSFCSCGTRGGFQLLMELNHWTFPRALEAVAGFLNIDGGTKLTEAEKERLQRKYSAYLKERDSKDAERGLHLAKLYNQIWSSAVYVGDRRAAPLIDYLDSRSLKGAQLSGHVKFHNSMDYKTENGTFLFPAMLARVFDCVTGKPVTIHRTFLGVPAGWDRKRCLPVVSRTANGWVIPVTSVSPEQRRAGVLGVSEGIETALAVSIAERIPCWSTHSAGLLPTFTPPSWVKRLVVYADNDRSNTGIQAAAKLRQELKRKGWNIIVEIKLPRFLPDSAKSIDWADVWRDCGVIGFNPNMALAA